MSHMVTLTYLYDIDAAQVQKLEYQFGEESTVSRVPGHSFSVAIPVNGDMHKATMVGLDLAERVMGGNPDGMEVLEEEEYVRRAEEPSLPELVSAPEVAQILGGVSRQRVHQLRETAGFPAPLYELRTGPIWDLRAIERFARDWTRKPGRPARVPSSD